MFKQRHKKHVQIKIGRTRGGMKHTTQSLVTLENIQFFFCFNFKIQIFLHFSPFNYRSKLRIF